MARGPEREDAVLAAVIAIATEVGYEATTIDAVARRAQASKATIYRRWRNKAELVGAALDTLDADDNATVPDTGALRSDLVAVLAMLRAKASAPYLALMTDLMLASRRDPELAAALQSHVADEELSPFLEVLQRAIVRGEIAADTDTTLIHDLAEAMILRQVQVGAALDEPFVERLVDGVLLPLLVRGAR